MSHIISPFMSPFSSSFHNIKRYGGMYMEFQFKSDLPYPTITPQKNLRDAKLLMPNYGGKDSELTAILQYVYQAYINFENEPFAKVLEGISMTEMHHHELLGEAIAKLGGYPVMGGHTYWNGSFVFYDTNPKVFLEFNIKAEETAIKNYERTILALNNEEVKLMLERIILDEELHIKIFRELIRLDYGKDLMKIE